MAKSPTNFPKNVPDDLKALLIFVGIPGWD